MHGRPPVKVYLHGPLADRYGAEHTLYISKPSEAIQAFDANYPGFLSLFVKHEAYAIYADGDWRGDASADFPVSKEVHFAPVIEGRAFLGAMLVTAIFPGVTAATATLIGGVLMAGLFIGISFLLTPKQKKLKDPGKDENYAFSGPENVTAQGAAVPIIYGRVFAGSVVASAGLELDVEYTTGPSYGFVANEGGSVLRALPAPLEPYPAPVGGFPRIVKTDKGDGPYGWQPAVEQVILGKRGETPRGAFIWTRPEPDQNGRHWAWTASKGFYSYGASATLEPSEYVELTPNAG